MPIQIHTAFKAEKLVNSITIGTTRMVKNQNKCFIAMIRFYERMIFNSLQFSGNTSFLAEIVVMSCSLIFAV